jgi:hypothetical protein
MADRSAAAASSNSSLPLGGQRLAPLAEAHALVVGQFEGQGLDFEVRRIQHRILVGDGLARGG